LWYAMASVQNLSISPIRSLNNYLVHSFSDVLGGRYVESAVVEERCSRDHDLSLLSMEI